MKERGGIKGERKRTKRADGKNTREKQREQEKKKEEKIPTLAMKVPQVPHRIDIGSIILTLSMFSSALLPRGTLAGSKSGG